MMAFGMDRLSALSQIESGDNDRAVGKAGEISRYQVRKNEWRSVTRSTRYRDPETAKQVVQVLVQRRLDRFEQIYRRPPTHFEFYALWNAPSQVYNGRISRTVAERAQRFTNLCEWESNSQASAEQQEPRGDGFRRSDTPKRTPVSAALGTPAHDFDLLPVS
jgi:hypothetical protein